MTPRPFGQIMREIRQLDRRNPGGRKLRKRRLIKKFELLQRVRVIRIIHCAAELEKLGWPKPIVEVTKWKSRRRR